MTARADMTLPGSNTDTVAAPGVRPTGTARTAAIRAVRRRVTDDGLNHANGRYALLRGAALALPVSLTTALTLVVGAWWCWVLHVVLATAVLCTLPSVYHEATHANISRNRTVNDIIGTVAAGLHVTPFATWRYFHLAHHANTGTDDDPEVYPSLWSRWTLLTFPLVQWNFVAILWKWTWATARGGGPDWIRTERQRAAVRNGAALQVFGLIGLLALTVWQPRLVGLLLLPAALSLMIASLTLVPEHFPAYRVGPGEPDQLDRTSTFRSHPLVRLLLWNSNFHAAHHFAPKVPAHHLARIDHLLSGIQDPRWRWSGYVQWYRERLRQLRWTPLDVTAPQSPVRRGNQVAR